MEPSDDALTEFTCPRCGAQAADRFYGPCASCRADLRTEQVVDAREVEVGRFEPTLHVVPNQVATKE